MKKIYISSDLNGELDRLQDDFTTAMYNYSWILSKKKNVRQGYNLTRIYQLCYQGKKAPFHNYALNDAARTQIQDLLGDHHITRDEMEQSGTSPVSLGNDRCSYHDLHHTTQVKVLQDPR